MKIQLGLSVVCIWPVGNSLLSAQCWRLWVTFFEL